LRYLARFQVMTLVEAVLGRMLLGVVHAGADAVPREMRTFPRGGGFHVCLAVSAGHGVDVASLNAFLAAALQRVVREAVLVQAPASASVVPSAGVRVVDTGVSGGIAASVSGHVGELAAVCRERVVVGAAGRRSSAGGAASCQVMSPGLSSDVSSTLVEGAPSATDLTRPALVPSPLHFHTPAH